VETVTATSSIDLSKVCPEVLRAAAGVVGGERGTSRRLVSGRHGELFLTVLDRQTFETVVFRRGASGFERVAAFLSPNGDPYLEIEGDRFRTAAAPEVLRGLRFERRNSSRISVESWSDDRLQRCSEGSSGRVCQYLPAAEGVWSPIGLDAMPWNDEVPWTLRKRERLLVVVVSVSTGDVRFTTELPGTEADGTAWGPVVRLGSGQLVALPSGTSRTEDGRRGFRYRFLTGPDAGPIREVTIAGEGPRPAPR
jgi:hypothetical protein